MGHSSPIGFGYGSAFSISYRAIDKKTKQWRELELLPEKKSEFDTAVQGIIREGSLGQAVVAKPGAEYQADARGIYRTEGGKRQVNLVNDKTISGKDRAFAKKALGILSKRVANAAHASGSVRIDITVAPPLVRDFDGALAKEYAYYEQINTILDNWNPQELKKQGYTDSQIKELKQKYEKLRDQVQQRLDFMDKTRGLMGKEGYDVGMNYFASKVQATHAEYLEAFRALQTDQQILEGRLGHQNKYLLDLTHPKTHEEAFQKLLTNAETLEIDTAVLLEASNVVTNANKTHFKSLELPGFFKVVDEHFSAEQTLCKQLTSFAAKFQQNEAGIRDVLRKNGHSDLEISYIFSHIENSAKVSRKMQEGLRVVRELILQEKYDEALQSYSGLMIEQYPQYSQMMSRGVLAFKEVPGFIQSGFDAKMIKSIQERFDIDFENLGSQMAPFMQRPLKVGLLSRETSRRYSVLKDMPETELPQHWKDACEVIAGVNDTMNEMVRSYERLTGGEAPLAALGDDAAWQQALRDQGLTKRDIAELEKYYSDQAKEFGPIYRGSLVVDGETDPLKKRMARAQLQKLCRDRFSNLDRLNLRFQKTGGAEKLGKLDRAIEQYREGSEKSSHLDQIAGMREVMGDRDVIFGQIYADVHLHRNWSSGSVDQLLKDKGLLSILEVKGFAREELAKMGRLYDEYSRVFEPVFLAKAALNDDPDNLQLQANLRKVYAAQLPKFAKLGKQMSALRMMDLTQALENESVQVGKHLESLQVGRAEDLSALGIKYEKTKAEEKEEVELLHRQEMLKTTPKYLKEVREMEATILAVEKDVKIGMSGDKGFVRKLLVKPKFTKDKVWLGWLAKHRISSKDLEELDRFQHGLSELMAPLQAADRALEADPGNPKLRSAVRKHTLEQAEKVYRFNKRFEEWGGLKKVQKVQLGVKAFKLDLAKRKKELKEAETLAKKFEKTTGQHSEQYKGAEEMYQKILQREFLSFEEIDQTLDQLDRANIHAQMRERRKYVANLFGRLNRGQI